VKKKIYVGCSLTQAPEEFKELIKMLQARLREEGYEVLDFVGLTVGTPGDVYQHDIHKCITACDLFLAICDYPAIGLGWELAFRTEVLRKPTLALARRETKLTRLLIGAGEFHPYLKIEWYSTVEDVIRLVKKKFFSPASAPGYPPPFVRKRRNTSRSKISRFSQNMKK